MNPRSAQQFHGNDRKRYRTSTAGMTLIEIMISMLVLIIVAVAVTTSLIQLRKQGENAVCQVLAQATAEGLLEQIRRVGFDKLSDTTTNPTVVLLFVRATSSVYADTEPYAQSWSADDTTYNDIGVLSDPADATSAKLGVLLDVDYKDSGGTVIRARRYMKMRINLRNSLNADKTAVQICLRYQWAVPERRTSAGGEIYYASREIRTVISKMPTY